MSAKDWQSFVLRIAAQVVCRQACDYEAPIVGRRWVEGGFLRRCWTSCVGVRSHYHPKTRALFLKILADNGGSDLRRVS